MHKRDYIALVANKLRDSDARKTVSIGKYRLYVSDSEGKTVHFDVKQKDRTVLYTAEDVAKILDACIDTVVDLLKEGENIQLKGFGTFGVQKRAETRVKAPGTDDWYEIPSTYVPKFQYGQSLRVAAKVYELSLKEKEEKERKQNELKPDYLEDELM